MKFKIVNWSFLINKSKKTGVWWHNVKPKLNTPNQRADDLVALKRIWIREYRVYVYQLNIGPYSMLFVETTKQKLRENETPSK